MCSKTKTLIHGIAILLFLVAPAKALAGWEVTWIDTFDGTSVDWSNWTAQTQADYNAEVQCYTDDDSSINQNYEVSSGTLKIIARKQAPSVPCVTLAGNPLREWTSGRLNSKDKAEFLYGRIEARIRFATVGAGTWPAFWMLENRIAEQPIAGDNDFVNWPNPGAGEIDVWEWVGKEPNTYVTNFYNAGGGSCGNLSKYTYPGGAAQVQQWHDYAVEWDANNVRLYIDDTLVVNHNVSSCPQYKEPMFVLINLAMGGTFGGPIAGSLTEATMEVDYVAHCRASTSNTATRCNEATPRASGPATPPPAPVVVATSPGGGSGGGGSLNLYFVLTMLGMLIIRRFK